MPLREKLLVAAMASSLVFVSETGAGTLVQDATALHGGITRYYDYYVPDSLPSGPVPLVFVLHGGTGSNKALGLSAYTLLEDVADSDPMILIRPNGTDPDTGLSGPSGSFNWNDCRADAGMSNTTADDVGFISALIDWAASNFTIDLDRVYATGPSNGGLMSYRLGLELSGRIAAIGAVIANLPADSECASAPARPLGVLIMNGTMDPLMPFEGGTVFPSQGPVVSTLATRDAWRGFLGTSPSPALFDLPNPNLSDSSRVSSEAYCNGEQGAALRLYTVKGGGHTIPSIAHPLPPGAEFLGPQNRDIEAVNEIWRFLRRHSRTSCAPCETWDSGTESCVAAPRTGCRQTTSASATTLSIDDHPIPERDKLAWKWSRGEATAIEDLGDPSSDGDYAFCVFDESGASLALAFRATVPADASTCGVPGRWKVLGGSKGYGYREKAGAQEGITKLDLRAGIAGKAKAGVKAAGANLSPRAFGMPPLPLSLPLRVQLDLPDGTCLEATYSSAGVSKNEPGRFKARADP